MKTTRTTKVRRNSAALSLLTALVAVPAFAQAQQNSAPPASTAPASPLDDKRVSLNVEDVTLSTAIRTLMTGLGADFTIDDALEGARVTAHLTNLRLKVVLATLSKASTLPITYKFEKGIYRFSPKVEPPPTPPQPAPKKPAPDPVQDKIKVDAAKARRIAEILSGNLGDPNAVLRGNRSNSDLDRHGETSSSGIINGTLFSGGGSSSSSLNGNSSRRSGGTGSFSLGSLLGMLFGGRRGR